MRSLCLLILAATTAGWTGSETAHAQLVQSGKYYVPAPLMRRPRQPAYSRATPPGFTRSGKYLVPDRMIQRLPRRNRETYSPSTRASGVPARAAQSIVGTVSRVVDGDTIDVKTETESVRVRLQNIDAPETGQPFAVEARRALAKLIFGQLVRVELDGTMSYGRAVGTVYRANRNVNMTMASGGLAWASSGQKGVEPELAYKVAQQRAREFGRGLWSDPNPSPPWAYRAVHVGP